MIAMVFDGHFDGAGFARGRTQADHPVTSDLNVFELGQP